MVLVVSVLENKILKSPLQIPFMINVHSLRYRMLRQDMMIRSFREDMVISSVVYDRMTA